MLPGSDECLKARYIEHATFIVAGVAVKQPQDADSVAYLGGLRDAYDGGPGITAGESSEFIELAKMQSVEARRETLRKRAISRFMQGAGFERLLLVTLTTPESFKGELHDAWRRFMARCRRRGLFRRYFAVREYNEKHTCSHLHVVFQTRTWLDVVALRRQWTAAVNAVGLTEIANVWTRNEWVRRKAGTAGYLAKYMLKAYAEGRTGRAYWYALTWVFPGFVRWTKGVWACGSGRADGLLWQVRQGGEAVAHKLLLDAYEAAYSLGVRPWSMRLIDEALQPYPRLRLEVGH